MYELISPAVNLIDKMNDDILVVLVGFLLIVATLFLWLWFANRRKYHNLKHAIPANVVKSYLDTIIHNSNALKSQLFRGGGLDSSGVPSVLSLGGLGGGDAIGLSGAPSTAMLEELNQKKAMVASLEAQLAALQNSNRELSAKFSQSQTQLTQAEARIKELEALLAKGGNGSDALAGELNKVTRERDELRERLKEFEIISDDLANLKRLQQENEQLRRSLAAQGTALPASAPAPVVEPESLVEEIFEDLGKNETQSAENKELEDFLTAPTDNLDTEIAPEPEIESEPAPEAEPAPAMEAQAPAQDNSQNKNDKTPEDLLSEFEKMLG